jgi:Ca2+-binding EF-hand superfamily protein
MKITTLITAFGLAAMAAQAGADTGKAKGQGGGMERLKQADTNADGMISRDEAKSLPMISKHFDEIDANKDGQVTSDELRAFHEKQRGDHWKKMDANGDGKISRDEASKFPRLADHFDKVDANKDGFLTPDELKSARGSKGQP